jgi:hypothetical protein
MKRLKFIFVCVSILACCFVHAQSGDKMTGTVNLVNVSVSQALDIYKAFSKMELVIETNISWDIHTITAKGTGLSAEAGTHLIQHALLEQAGVVITPLDTNRALVTYDRSLPIKSSGMQQQRIKLALTPAEVDPKSVHVITQPTSPWQNLVFRYVGKTSEEIKAIAVEHPEIQIVKDGVVVTETDGGCALRKKIANGQTNNIGLVLLFSDYEKAKLAEKTLRGD